MGRKLRQLDADLIQRQSDLLREYNESHAPKDGARKPPLSGAFSLRSYQPALLIETQGRGGNAASTGDVSDVEQLFHARNVSFWALDFKFT